MKCFLLSSVILFFSGRSCVDVFVNEEANASVMWTGMAALISLATLLIFLRSLRQPAPERSQPIRNRNLIRRRYLINTSSAH